MKKLLGILFIFTILGQAAFAKEKKKTTFAKKYQKAVDSKLKKLSVNEKIELLLGTRIKDFYKNVSKLDYIHKELVQFFGKRQRNFIHQKLEKLKNVTPPKVKLKGNAVYVSAYGKTLKVKVVSFVWQKFSINEDLIISLRDFPSLENYLAFIMPKLEIVMNASNGFHLFPTAHAARRVNETELLAITLALVMINVYHGRSDACYEMIEVYVDEFKDMYESCQQEDRNFNPANIESMKKLADKWQDFQYLTGVNISSKNPCQRIGQYFENENSISCGYDNSFKENHEVCKQLVKINSCLTSLEKKVLEYSM